MLTEIISRIGYGIMVLLVVALMSFVIFRFVGDPINQMVNQNTTAEVREQLKEDLGLNDNIIVQFSRFVGNMMIGNFGISYQYRKPVSEIIFSKLPATLELAFISFIFAFIIGVILGVISGVSPNSLISKAVLAISLIGVSVPTFLIGILMIYIFAVQFHVVPSFGRSSIITFFWLWDTSFTSWEGWKSILMPAVTLGLFQMTLIIRLIRSELMEVLKTDYIKFAKARGLPNRVINYKHALKNTMMPVITINGLQIGSIIAFAIITETVFQWPGMGMQFLKAIQNVDIPVMAAYLMLMAVFFVMINTIIDVLYTIIDPRLRKRST